MAKTIIKVTQKDIDRAVAYFKGGGHNLADNCPIARAARRAFDANVAFNSITLRIGGGHGEVGDSKDYTVPQVAVAFAKAFDAAVLRHNYVGIPAPVTFTV